MNILYLNDYSIENTYKGVIAGIDHAAHLWGYDYLSKYENTQYLSINKKILNFQKKLLINKILGDIYQEIKTLLKRNKFDLTIAANINLIWGLGYIKKLIKLPPIIAILHSLPQSTNWLYKIFLRNQLSRIEKIICIAKKDYVFLKKELGMPSSKVYYIQWAANLADYDRLSTSIINESYTKDRYIISMGKSNRDYRTLIKAFKQIVGPDLYLKIYCGGSRFKNFNENRININYNFISFKDSIKEYKNAEFVVVPLIKSDRTLGLTSMFDAMAMGKAFIITRNAGIDIDVEKEKIGLWTNPYNIDQLKDKMQFLLDSPTIARQYGKNGKEYLAKKYNYRKFCEELHNIAKRTYEQSTD